MPEHWQIGPPVTRDDWAALFKLRWEVLRAPWQQPPGSERDAEDGPGSQAEHCLVRSARGEALGVGRLHRDEHGRGVIRYMAVAEQARGQGIGSAILDYLETRARALGITHIRLNARASAAGFYRRHGYIEAGAGPCLFGEIAHVAMYRELDA